MITYLTLTQSQSQSTMRSQAWNLSIAVVEAGIQQGEGACLVNAAAETAGGLVGSEGAGRAGSDLGRDHGGCGGGVRGTNCALLFAAC